MKKNGAFVNIALNDSSYSTKQENDWRKKCRQKTSAPFITYYRSEHRDNRQTQKLNLRVYLMNKKKQHDHKNNQILFQNDQIV